MEMGLKIGKSRPNQAGSFLSSAFLYCYKNRFIEKQIAIKIDLL